ncbi:MAG: chromosomal replication initiator protein DnaA [Clostridia bacterium]|jgi:chromosomal replication initiator protein|nr:chromosomal replication initiator protein DnaA [Clostridia bacterium]MCI9290917.1 chromosomal replication initiator protein DnaA [Clostridia bacterium]
MEDCKKIWNELLIGISNNISTVSYEMWFNTLEPLTIAYNKLIVVAKLKSTKNTINNNYRNLILDEIKKLGYSYITDYVIITPDEISIYENQIQEDKKEAAKESAENKSIFNSDFTFDKFVVGQSNQIVYAAAKAVATQLGTLHNPLFIYGGVGLGKTHIMHAIGNEILKTNKKVKIIYCTTEQFVNDFIDSIKNNKDNEQNRRFREKYRNVDLLMLDDIQFLAGKTGTQEALFHTFNDLYQFKKQIILSSDRHPKELTFLEERLQSRFASGLTVDISTPDLETRIAILQKKALFKNVNLPIEVVYFIAEKIDSNIRELEGALQKVIFYCQLLGKEPDNIDIIKEALKDDIDVTTHILSLDTIVDATCSYFNVKKQDIIGKKKLKPIVNARQIAIYLIYDILGVPLATIGSYFGGKDHTTIIYARDKIEDLIKTDNLVANQIKDIKNMIQKR